MQVGGPQKKVLTRVDHAYRRDIDGLRAISVLAVIAFHFGYTGLPGGFTGVDVFFVISGFLITGMLLTEVADGNAPVLAFYNRRIKRILPALLVVIAACLVGGFILQLPGDFVDTAESARYAVFGLSNFYFIKNTGYFDQAADLQVLLHTWSLAVEEQFYLVWPLLIFLLASRFGRGRRTFLIVTVSVIAASFLLNLYLTATEPKVAFYMLPGRAWELALGALLLFAPRLKNWQSELATSAGIALIVAGFLLVNDTEAFPGFYALYPCIGAALVIWPKDGRSIAASGLGTLFPIGLISYSLYLWHWPVLVFFKFYNNNQMPGLYEAAGLIVITFFLSLISWHFVEVRFRRTGGWKVAAGALGTAVALFAVGTVVLRTDGAPGRLPTQVAGLQSLDVMWKWDCPKTARLSNIKKDRCIFGAPWDHVANKAFLWGDSHAQHMAPLLEPFVRDGNSSVLLFRECPPFLDGENALIWRPREPKYTSDCAETWLRAVSLLKRHPEINTVILTAAWSSAMKHIYQKDKSERSIARGVELMTESLNALIEEIGRPGRRIFLIGDVPRWSHDPVPCELALAGFPRRPCTLDESSLSSRLMERVQRPVAEALASIAAKHSNVTAILPVQALCQSAHCITKLDGEPLYRDQSHIRRNLPLSANLQLGRLIGLDAVFAFGQ